MQTGLSNSAQLKIEYRPIESLTPYAGCARKHPRNQIRKIAKSMRQFGWTNPILVDAEGTVLCGHGRLEAAKLNGDRSVPVIALEHLSEADRKAYIIADNRIAEDAQWSKIALRTELNGLAELGYDLEVTGFSSLEIDTVLSMDDDPSDEDAVELPSDEAEAVSRVGDLWEIGEHKLLVGDARDPKAYQTLLNGELAQLIATDPPCGCAIENNVSGGGKVKHGDFVMGAGETSLADFANGVLAPSFQCMADNAQAGAIAFIFIDWRGAPYLYEVADRIFCEAKNMIVWAKTNGGQGAFYRSAHELIYAFKVSEGRHINNFGLSGRYRTNVWSYAGANTFRAGRMEDLADHPTVKPRKMISDAILDCSKRRGIVLDPFVGAGTTLCAAEETGRLGRGIELDPKYADVTIRRLAEMCGKQPTIGGIPFEEIVEARSEEELA